MLSSGRRMLHVLTGGAVVFAMALCLSDATAKTSFDSGYTLEQSYNATLRLVRVDRGFKITEKDPAAAYVLFEYKSVESGDKATSGSIELVPSGDVVKVVVQLTQMPRYHETVLADALQKKLRDEYGIPPPRKPPSAPPATDGGAPDADGG